MSTCKSDKSDCSSWMRIRNSPHALCILDLEPVVLFVGQLMSFDTMTMAKFCPRWNRFNENARPKLDAAADDSSAAKSILSR